MRIVRFVAAAALFLASSCSQAAANPPSPELLLSEFRTACWGVNADNLTSKARQAGWMPYDPEPGSYFARQRSFGQVEAAKFAQRFPDSKFTSDDKLFSKQVGDRRLYLWVAYSGMQKSGDRYKIINCNVSDPSATQAIPLEALDKFGGRSPEPFGGGLVTAYRWAPGLDDGQTDTVVMFIPKSSEAGLAAMGPAMTGLSLKQQTVEKTSK